MSTSDAKNSNDFQPSESVRSRSTTDSSKSELLTPDTQNSNNLTLDAEETVTAYSPIPLIQLQTDVENTNFSESSPKSDSGDGTVEAVVDRVVEREEYDGNQPVIIADNDTGCLYRADVCLWINSRRLFKSACSFLTHCCESKGKLSLAHSALNSTQLVSLVMSVGLRLKYCQSSYVY